MKSAPLARPSSLGAFAFAALCAVACGDPPDGQPHVVVDGSVLLEDGGTEALVQVGTGTESFEPLVDGQEVKIIAGPQGGYHVWTSVRVRAPVDPKSLNIAVRLVKDGLTLEQTDYRMNLTRRGAYHETYALLAMVPQPSAVVGEEVSLTVEIVDRTGLSASDARRIVLLAP